MARQLSTITPPPSPGGPGRLGEKIEATIERVIAWTVNTAGDAVSSILRRGLELLFEILAEILAPYAQSMHDEIMDNPAVPQYVKDTLRRPSATTDMGDALFSIVYIVTAVVGGWRGLIAPSSRLSEQYVDKSLFSARPGPDAAWPMAWRTEDVAFYRAAMQELGWHPDFIDAFEEVLRPRMAAVDLFRAAHRGEISFADARRELQLQGWSAEDVNRVEALTFQLPGAGDLIAMSVRGAFNPDEITEFQLGAEFPAEFAEWMERQGYSTDWAQRYWYSHWVLPPLTAGYEMLHRGIIDSDQLDLLLKTQDISPFWRDKLRELSYNPLTRVDVRRMYGLGVLDRDAVYRSYLDIGYSPENAERMTEFTIRYETDEDRDATKTDILAGFREGMLTEAEATDWLVTIGYGTEVAGFLVAREAAKLARSLLDQEIEILEDLYKAREINEADARAQLTALGLASNEIDLKITEWSIARRSQLKRPTQDQASRFLRDDIITVEEFRQTLTNLGYQDQYIDWYLENVLTLKEEDLAKREQDAREEAEKVRLRAIKNDYQIAKADLDVQIAQLKTAIADMQLAIQARSRRYREERHAAEGLLTETQIRENAAADIAGFEAQIDAQREAVAYLRSQIEARQTTIADLQLQAETQRQEAEPEIETAQAEVDRLQAVLLDLGEQIDSGQTAQAQARQVIAETTADVETLRADIADVQMGIRDYQARIEAAQTAIAEAREIIANAPADVEVLRVEIAGFEADVEAHQVTIDDLQTQIAELNLQIAEIEEALPGQIAAATSEEEAATIEAQAAQAILERQTDIASLRVEIEQNQDSIAEIDQAILADQERVRVMGVGGATAIAEQRVAIAELQVQIEGYQDTITSGQAAIAETQEQIRVAEAESEEAVTGQRAIIAALAAEIESLQDQQAATRTAIQAARAEVAQLELPFTRTNTAIRQSQLVIEQSEDDIAEANADVAALTTQINARREQMRQELDLVARVRSLEQIETEYRTEIDVMEQQLTALKIALSEAREQKAQLQLEYREDLVA